MPRWTEEQTDAICARRGTVLVSAAAGSGKTAVLTERVVQRITDPAHPADADRLLVVTFTKAAAAEMRERIDRRLRERIRETPGDLRLERQQLLLQQAMICTVDSFCTSIVREFFYLLGLAPDFSVVTDKQQEELMAESMEQVLGELYADASFQSLADGVSGDRDDRQLVEAVQKLYGYMQSHPFPETWLKNTVAMLDPACPARETPWGRAALRHAEEVLAFAAQLTRSEYAALEQNEKLMKGYGEGIASDARQIQMLLEEVRSGDWDRVSHAFTGKLFGAIGKCGNGVPGKAHVKAMRDTATEEVGKLQKLFVSDALATQAELAALRPLAEALMRAVLRFGEVYGEKKRRKNLVDFSDLEHFALQLFLKETEDGYAFTETAKTVAARFDEVMTDEYQDTNEVQDLLFEAVSQNGQNRFMVGDVKQSIYSFRQATPEIFIRRRDRYPRYDRAADAYPATIVLGQNFRSRREVTESVNDVFGQLMSRRAGGVDYGAEDALIHAAEYPEKPGCETEIEFLEDVDGEGAAVLEPRHIAHRIQKLLRDGFTVTENGAERPARYGDFCVLLRSANKYAADYAENLRALGVPARAEVTGGFFLAGEISMLLSFLRVVDNPDQDIPLLAVLMSPVFGFSADDLAALRREGGRSSLYVALLGSEDPRARDVLESLRRWRVLASTMSADGFIAALTEQTGFENIIRAMPGGEMRLANLRLLQKYAAEYETYGTGGISGFVRFVDRLQRSRSDLESANTAAEAEDAVRVMSIHKAKGLEFPVCIIAGCGRNFVRDYDDLRLDPKLGIGMRIRDPETQARRTTLPREAIAIAAADRDASEELRVFYVAMTRAREKLILVSTVQRLDNMLGKLAPQLTQEEKLAPYAVNSARCIADWLLLAALRHPAGGVLRQRAGLDESVVLPALQSPWRVNVRYLPKEAAEPLPAPPRAAADPALREKIEAALRFRYPFGEETLMPTKVSASGLAAVRAPEAGTRTLQRPAFLGAKGMTPAERGTALHDFMRFCVPEAAAADPKAELERLTREKFLTPQQAEAVDLRRVGTFFSGEVGQRVLHADRVCREQRFIAPIPARLVNESLTGEAAETPVLLQGAVDCMIEESGKLWIIDFKTDRIRDKAELWAHYGTQLELYAEAMAQVEGKPVAGCMLYSFYLGEPVFASDAKGE